MVENGVITVTCEFCSSNYVFEPDKVDGEAASAERAAANKPLN